MIVLDDGDKIRGDASAATVVDYTLHGVVTSTLTQLADGQLASSIGDLYTASAIVVITTIILVNTDSSARTVNLYLTPSGGTARRLIPKDTSLGVGYSLHFDGAKVSILNPTGGVVTSYGVHAASHTDGTDDVQDATDSVKGLATAAQITKLDGIATGATVYPDTGEQAFLDADHSKLDGIDAGADVTGSNPPQAHKNSHDPIDGGDKLDSAAPVKVGDANAIGSSHSFSRADHVHEKHHGAIATITFTIDGGGSAITTGLKTGLEIPFACTITQSTLLGVLPASTSGSIVLDIWKDTYANHPPTVADTITASAKPTISSAQKAQDSTLTGWTTAIAAGDILFVNVDSITTFTAVTLSLRVTKT